MPKQKKASQRSEGMQQHPEVEQVRVLYLKLTRMSRDVDRHQAKGAALKEQLTKAAERVAEHSRLAAEDREGGAEALEVASAELIKANRQLKRFSSDRTEREEKVVQCMEELRDYLTSLIQERRK